MRISDSTGCGKCQRYPEQRSMRHFTLVCCMKSAIRNIFRNYRRACNRALVKCNPVEVGCVTIKIGQVTHGWMLHGEQDEITACGF